MNILILLKHRFMFHTYQYILFLFHCWPSRNSFHLQGGADLIFCAQAISAAKAKVKAN